MKIINCEKQSDKNAKFKPSLLLSLNRPCICTINKFLTYNFSVDRLATEVKPDRQ